MVSLLLPLHGAFSDRRVAKPFGVSCVCSYRRKPCAALLLDVASSLSKNPEDAEGHVKLNGGSLYCNFFVCLPFWLPQDVSKYSGTLTHVIRSCVTIVFLTNVFQNFMIMKTGMMDGPQDDRQIERQGNGQISKERSREKDRQMDT
jgi:hypothetical protein